MNRKKTNLPRNTASSRLVRSGASSTSLAKSIAEEASLPGAPAPDPPTKPTNGLHTAAAAVGSVAGIPGIAIDPVNTRFATATQSLANAFPSRPAATIGSLAIGIPHAHIAHPPSGPFPVPPTPFPPVGAIAIGSSVQVLINGLPAARCGDLGLSPTCCAITPIFEMFTGSSNVFIGGARAARMGDLSFHCRLMSNSGASRAAAGAAKATAVASKIARVGQLATTAAMAGGMAAQGLTIAGDGVEAAKTDDAAMSAALGTNAKAMAAQMAVDMMAMAVAMTMGKDQPAAPPSGTIGTLTIGAPNVLIGGFPMPAWMDIARGLGKLAKALRRRRNGRGQSNGRRGRGRRGCPGK